MALTSLYLDHAATTPLLPEVRARLNELWSDSESYAWANSSSAHTAGAKAAAILESARTRVAKSLGCAPQEIVFLGSATEANNWFLRSTLTSTSGSTLATAISSIEHSSVREPAQLNPKHHIVPVDSIGRLNLQALEDSLRAGVRFVSIVLVNNEIGVRQDSLAIAQLCRKYGALYHADAAQALGHGRQFKVSDTGADCITFNGHKIGAPKGIAVAYCRSGLAAAPLLLGGGHERGRRSGTVAVELADAFSVALDIAQSIQSTQSLFELRQHLCQTVEDSFPGVRVNGPRKEAEGLEGHILSLTFPQAHSKTLVEELNRKRVYCSSGSACGESKVGGSLVNPIMRALGHPDDESHHVRLSFNFRTSNVDHRALTADVVERLELCLKELKTS